jgi:hypothetical protein
MNLTATAAYDPVGLHSSQPLAVPVFSGAGGVGRSTVSALIAALLEARPAARGAGTVVLYDTAVRGHSPWPEWVDIPAQFGTIHVLGAPHPRQRFAEETSAASIFETVAGRSVLVLTDTGAGTSRTTAMHTAPHWWSPVLRGARAIVVDGDAYEGVRLRRHLARPDQPSVFHRWQTALGLRAALVWVTDASAAGYARTAEAMEAADVAGVDLRRLTVVVNHTRVSRSSELARTRRAAFVHRIGATVDLRLDPVLASDGGRPRFSGKRLARADARKLLAALLRASRPRH